MPITRPQPTETDRKRRDRTCSASSTRVGLASIATSSDPYTFYIRQSKNRRDQSSFRGAESQRPNCSTFPSLQRNGLPPPQHNLVEVRLSPPPPMATRRRTMDGRLAEDAMILIDTRRQSRVALAVAAGSPDSFVGSDWEANAKRRTLLET